MKMLEILFWLMVGVWFAFFLAWLTLPEPEYIAWMIATYVVLLIVYKIGG